MPQMAKILSTADPEDAAAAVMTFAELGADAVPGLCEALKNKETCYWAAMALAEIGKDAQAAVPALGALLESPDPEMRMEVLVALGEIGPAAKPQVGAINEILATDEVAGVRYAAAYALGMIGDQQAAGEVLVKSLDSEDPFLRVAGAWALLRVSKGKTPLLGKAVQEIMDGLTSDNADVRGAAARAIADSEIPDNMMGPALRMEIEALQADDPAKVTPIIDALAALGSKVVPACIRSLSEKRPLRFQALQVLIGVGPAAAPAVPSLMATLGDEDPLLRRESLFALGAIGPAAAKATQTIAEKLTDADPDVKHAACYALGKIGPAAQAALPALAKQMNSDDEFLQIASVWASLRISPDDPELKEKAVPFLVKALVDVREHVRIEAAYMLGEMGDIAKGAVPALKRAADDKSPAVRAAAASALEQLQ